MYNVKDFSVVGDGTADDTAALQFVLDLAATQGGAMVYVPRGVYKLSIGAASRALRLRARVSIIGEGQGLTVFKLADTQGNYETIFGHDLADSIDDITLTDFSIDQNRQNNPVTYANEAAWLADQKGRMAVRLYKAKRLRVQNVRFLNCDTINTFTANGVIEDIWVSGCQFDAGNSPIDHDHSSIYVNGTRAFLTFNSFVGSGDGARAAFDLHGDSIVDLGNIVTGYLNSTNVVSNKTVVTNNVFDTSIAVESGWGSTLTKLAIGNNV